MKRTISQKSVIARWNTVSAKECQTETVVRFSLVAEQRAESSLATNKATINV